MGKSEIKWNLLKLERNKFNFNFTINNLSKQVWETKTEIKMKTLKRTSKSLDSFQIDYELCWIKFTGIDFMIPDDDDNEDDDEWGKWRNRILLFVCTIR